MCPPAGAQFDLTPAARTPQRGSAGVEGAVREGRNLAVIITAMRFAALMARAPRFLLRGTFESGAA
jgi:hypothetical protein